MTSGFDSVDVSRVYHIVVLQITGIQIVFWTVNLACFYRNTLKTKQKTINFDYFTSEEKECAPRLDQYLFFVAVCSSVSDLYSEKCESGSYL